ncbi:sensor histidine kinase [Streptomyces sp. NPDC048514]|uniref:sensor histidine kinase n=1 Tax=Streptomyces sp. NPDC048514 TaxID=3365564 RepID=UPI0037133055
MVRLPARSRLAILLAATFLGGGAVLLALVYVMVARRSARVVPVEIHLVPDGVTGPSRAGHPRLRPADGQTARLDSIVHALSRSFMRELLGASLTALILLAVMSALLGWWVSGRLLSPVAHMARVAGRLSQDDLHQRIALTGPDDEIKRLADAFDGLLERLQRAFEAQRRFIAQVSHEFCTPLAVQRTILEVRLRPSDPAAVERVKALLLDGNRRLDRLVSGLRTLAESDCGLDQTTPTRLGSVVSQTIAQYGERAAETGVRVSCSADDTRVQAHPVLLRHLIGNLLTNALAYNTDDGWVTVTVSKGVLRVANSGAPVEEDCLGSLFEPFRRHEATHPRPTPGAGLGLSIVRSIAQAHGATVAAEPRSGGGLVFTVRFEPCTG